MNKHHTSESELSNQSDWSDKEFSSLRLGDSRLERRLVRVAGSFMRSPGAPINRASCDVASMKAAYRLFDNEKVTSDGILEAHRNQVLERLSAESIVLAIQDTTFVDFTSHVKTKDLGPLSTKESKGICLHSSFACTTNGVPAGLLYQRYWVRADKDEPGDLPKNRPPEEKESHKWFEAMREVSQLDLSAQVVHVGDRENDNYEFFKEAHQEGRYYLVRCQYNRIIPGSDGESSTIEAQLDQVESPNKVSIYVASRSADVEFVCSFCSFTLPGTKRTRIKDKFPLTIWAIRLVELNPPEGEPAVKWTLLTNVQTDNLEDALERVRWYEIRWRIEEFHKILKSGCAIETCRLQTFDRLVRFIALKSVVAWRIFWLTHMNRVAPRKSATTVLTNLEIQALKKIRRFRDTLGTQKNITVRQAIVAIARLGGYLGRKKDPPPGNLAMWKGIDRLSMAVEAIEPDTCG